MQLSIAAASELLQAALGAVGYTPAEAGIISQHLMDCELRGLSYGGLSRALGIVDRVRNTPSERRPIKVLKETPFSAAIDGGDQVGYLVAQQATELAIAKARTTGIAVVGAYETWYTGMFSYYLEQVTQAGLAGMIAGSGGQIVAPHNGTQARFGTNPIAFGFPSTAGPVIWDIGTSNVMLAEVLLKLRLGQPLPEGLAFDAAGNPTLQPGAALQGGAFTVWGGHKGSGLAMVVQLLGMMCGAAAAPNGLRDCGFFLVVIDPELLTSGEDYRQRVAAYAESLRTTRPLDPSQPVRVPFERSAATRARTLEAGSIEVAEPVHAALSQLVAAVGV